MRMKLLIGAALVMGLLAEVGGMVRAQTLVPPGQVMPVQEGKGALITGVFAGWPANRSRTDRGRPVSLENGDIVVEVDGSPIRTAGDLAGAIQSSNGAIRLEVIDCRTNRQIGVWVNPIWVNGVRMIGVNAKTVNP